MSAPREGLQFEFWHCGHDKIDAVDRVANAARSFGLADKIGNDVIQAKLAEPIAESAKPKRIQAPPKPRLVPIPWSEIHRLPPREALIDGLLDRGAMSVVYGGSNTGKTFLVLDLSVCNSLGTEWRGQNFVRVGARVRYRESDIVAFLEHGTRTSTSSEVPAA